MVLSSVGKCEKLSAKDNLVVDAQCYFISLYLCDMCAREGCIPAKASLPRKICFLEAHTHSVCGVERHGA